jgi:hypothetical protein
MSSARTQPRDVGASAHRLRRIAALVPAIFELSATTRTMILRSVDAALKTTGVHQDTGPTVPMRETPASVRATRAVHPGNPVHSHRKRLDQMERLLAGTRRTFEEVLRLTRAACRQCDKEGGR